MGYTQQQQYDKALTMKDILAEFAPMTDGEITSTDLAAMMETSRAVVTGAYNARGEELGITRRRNENNFWVYSPKG